MMRRCLIWTCGLLIESSSALAQRRTLARFLVPTTSAKFIDEVLSLSWPLFSFFFAWFFFGQMQKLPLLGTGCKLSSFVSRRQFGLAASHL